MDRKSEGLPKLDPVSRNVDKAKLKTFKKSTLYHTVIAASIDVPNLVCKYTEPERIILYYCRTKPHLRLNVEPDMSKVCVHFSTCAKSK